MIRDPEARPGTLVAFSSRDYRLLWGGQTISFLGDAAFVVALSDSYPVGMVGAIWRRSSCAKWL